MTKIGRNNPCPCGSGKKYKKCCLERDEIADRESAHDYQGAAYPLQGEIQKGEYESSKMTPNFFSYFLSKEEVDEYETEAIIEKLRSFGIEFTQERFLEDILSFKSAEDLAKQWQKSFDVSIEGRDGDFPWLACMVLWDRLAPDVLYAEQLDDMIEEGYSLLDDQRPEACDIWLLAWEKVKERFALGYLSVEALDDELRLYQSLFNWCQDLEMELGNAGIEAAIYHEKRIVFCEEFMQAFPETSDGILLNFRCSVALSRDQLDDHAGAEKDFQKLTAEHPDWLWGYIHWGDMYYDKDCFSEAERVYRMALDKGLEDEEETLSERLADVERKRSNG